MSGLMFGTECRNEHPKNPFKVRTLDTAVSEILKKITQQRAVTNLQFLGLLQISVSNILPILKKCNSGENRSIRIITGCVQFFLALRAAKALRSRVLLFFASQLHQNRKRRMLTHRTGRNRWGCGALWGT